MHSYYELKKMGVKRDCWKLMEKEIEGYEYTIEL